MSQARPIASRALAAPGARLAAAGVAVVALAAVRLPGRPATMCLLRGVTGVPCPFCGSTTAAVELGHGHLLAALAASPLAVVGGLALVATSHQQRTRWTARVSRRGRLVALAAVLLASWAWQMHRFALL